VPALSGVQVQRWVLNGMECRPHMLGNADPVKVTLGWPGCTTYRLGTRDSSASAEVTVTAWEPVKV